MSQGFLCTSMSYIYMNLVLMFLGIWSIAQHENADAVLMVGAHVSRDMRKPTMLFLNRFYTNRVVQAQKMARGWKFWI